MGTITPLQAQQMLERTERNRGRRSATDEAIAILGPDGGGIVRKVEGSLHERIIAYCDSQWPRWKYIHARMDVPSTLAVGAQDFTLFLPHGRTVCIECKKPGGKLDTAQRDWGHEMGRLGHTVFIVTTWDEFLDVVKEIKT